MLNVGVAFVVCLVTLTFALGAEQYIEDVDRFPGWKGELPDPNKTSATKQQNKEYPHVTVGFGVSGQEHWRGEVQQISWSPRAFLLKGFLTNEECDHLIQLAKPKMTKSSVVDNDTGKSVDSQVRTSTGTFFARGQDEIITAIEKRIGLVSMLPAENGEGLQVLHYVDGQKYDAHHDYFHDQFNARPEHGGQRVATVLMYLTTVQEGGETVFPAAAEKVSGDGWSECAKNGLAVHPVRGDALLFYSLHPDGTVDPASLHGSCPTLKGEKWSATKWIHVKGFGLDEKYQKARWGDCIDADDRCSEWAAVGECKKNPDYMLSHCIRSCCTGTPNEKFCKKCKAAILRNKGKGATS